LKPLVISTLLAVLISQATAFIVSPGGSNVESQIQLTADLVVVPVSVRDRRNQYVVGLKADDFEIYDNGKRQEILFFVNELDLGTTGRPIALALLLDSSGSIAAILHQQRSAVESILEGVGQNILVSLIRFNDQPEVIAGLTKEKPEVLTAFRRFAPTKGNTAIFDSVRFTINYLDQQSTSAYRRVILLISDGLDTASQTKFTDCIKAAEEAGVTIYSIFIPFYSPSEGRLVPRPASPGVEEIAERTGGRMFEVGSVDAALNMKAKLDLTPVFQQILDELRNQYYIGFYPASDEKTSQYHPIQVKLRRGGLRIHLGRRGYYKR
jgi:VWFA-related protein